MKREVRDADASRLQRSISPAPISKLVQRSSCARRLHGSSWLRLRVRLHPRAGAEGREIFDWLDTGRYFGSTPGRLADDIKKSGVVLAVRSTAAIEAMIAGVPCVWLSPASAREQLKFSTLRAQNLTPLEASTPGELRAILERLRDIEGERQRIVDHQWARLRAVGYDRDYFDLVASALRRMVGVVRAETSD